VNKVILNWQRPPWEGDQEVVKRSGRDKPIQVAIHMCMEAMLGISLYSYLYLQRAKMVCLPYYFLFSLQQKSENKRQNRFCPEAERRGAVARTMYTHVSKCKNNKIKGEKKK
jgi:hypothetical protein